jgi:hypothetical protein
VAARIEALADPGGILISRSARDQIKDKLDVLIGDRGEVRVKNIARPVHVFKVNWEKGRAIQPKVALFRKPSILALAALVTLLVSLPAIFWWAPW